MADSDVLVTFVQDVYPHCKGDTVRLSGDELKSIDNKAYVLEGEEAKPKTKKSAQK